MSRSDVDVSGRRREEPSVPEDTTQEQRIRQLDQSKRAAMVHGDLETLEALLDESIVWVHSSGLAETKDDVLRSIGSGAINYLSIDVSSEEYRHLGPDVAMLTGVATLTALVNDNPLEIKARYTIIWSRTDHGWRVIHWQSTPTP
jgi:uncharacterized protein (TIGR02246 family)